MSQEKHSVPCELSAVRKVFTRSERFHCNSTMFHMNLHTVIQQHCGDAVNRIALGLPIMLQCVQLRMLDQRYSTRQKTCPNTTEEVHSKYYIAHTRELLLKIMAVLAKVSMLREQLPSRPMPLLLLYHAPSFGCSVYRGLCKNCSIDVHGHMQCYM